MYNQIPYMMPNFAAPAANAATTGTSLLSKISISSLLSNAQKTLNVVNQAIPLYYQVKPVFKNIKTLGKIGRELNKVDKNDKVTVNNNIISNISSNNKIKEEKSNDIPTPSFFI